MNKIHKYLTEPIHFALILYLLSLVIMAPWGNFGVSDDFYYITQVKAFSMGIFTKSALIAPNLILQTFLGLFWSVLFGTSYLSMHVFTIIVTIVCLIGFDKLLSHLKIKSSIKTVTLLMITFLPPFYALSLTFLSENYFLVFVVWSLLYFLRYLDDRKIKHLLLASVLGGLTIMVRQYGVVVMISYTLVFAYINIKRINLKHLAAFILPFAIFGALGMFWPKYQNPLEPKSLDPSLFFTSLHSLISRVFSLRTAPYIGFILIPFCLNFFLPLKKYSKIIIFLILFPLAYNIYELNIFRLGNLFYLEGLYARLLPNVRENLFNNIPFKLFMATLTSFSFVTFVFALAERLYANVRSKAVLKINDKSVPLILLYLSLLSGFFLIVMITDRVFDRYLINFFIFTIIGASYFFNQLNYKVGISTYLGLLFTGLITFLLVFDYYHGHQLKWEMAEKLTKDAKITRYQIFIGDSYPTTEYMSFSGNYKGLLPLNPQLYRPVCFIQEYAKQENNWLNDAINIFQAKSKVQRFFKNPTIDEAGVTKYNSSRYKPEDKLYYDEEYTTPIYNLLGKRMFVRAFCKSGS